MLYLRDSSPEASPKAISGRTSYLRVRLAFHPYPPLIPAFFNRRGCGPPVGVTRPSPWTWVDHSVSGRRRATKIALFKLAFATAPRLPLNLATHRHSPVHSTKGTPSSRLPGLRLLVGTRFQVLFHSPPGVLFTFPSRYWCAIGRQGVFSLGRWASLLPTGFPVPRGTRGPSRSGQNFAYRILTFSDGPFQAASAIPSVSHSL